jgi:phytoene dehydrogenase-like protein
MSRYDVIVIGAGVNGLVAAATLAKLGKRVVVLERRDVAGGTNVTEEFHPGFRATSCRDEPGWLPSTVVDDLGLARHGLTVVPAPGGLVGVTPDGPALATYPDIGRTVDGLRQVSAADAERWGDFCAFTGRVAGFLQATYAARPPRVQSRSLADLFALGGLGRRLRGYGRTEMMEILRAVPMPISDVGEEWFTHPALRALLAVQGTRDVLHGPFSGGTALVFMHQQVGRPVGAIGVTATPRGGGTALVEAVLAAARSSGTELRLGAEVSGVIVKEGRARGVVLQTGEEVLAANVLSTADPQRSFSWIEPMWLDPALLAAVDRIRMRGATARVLFALDGLPAFQSGGREVPRDAIGGTMILAPSVEAVERAYDTAKFGRVPDSPALAVTLPTITDPTLAPERRHVMAVTVQHVPHARTGGWDGAAATALGERVTQMLLPIAPDLVDRMLARDVVTPADLEFRYGCTGGSLTHGELALDQFLFMRPVPGCARYAAPLPGFWLGGTGSHPASAAGAPGYLAARALLDAR